MPTIPSWLRGKNTTLLQITPQTLNESTGDLADTTPVRTYTATFRDFAIEVYTETEQVQPATSQREHNIPIMDGHAFSLNNINLVGTEPDPLLGAYVANRYFKIVATRGGKSATFFALCDRVTTGTSGQGSQTTGATFKCVDTGAEDFFVYAS